MIYLDDQIHSIEHVNQQQAVCSGFPNPFFSPPTSTPFARKAIEERIVRGCPSSTTEECASIARENVKGKEGKEGMGIKHERIDETKKQVLVMGAHTCVRACVRACSSFPALSLSLTLRLVFIYAHV